MKIAIVTNQARSSVLNSDEGLQEDQQSFKTVKYIMDALTPEYDILCIPMDMYIFEKLQKENVDFVFNLCNGISGEASLVQLPSMLEFAGIPYTGSGPLPHALAYNKIIAGKIFKASGISTPNFICVKNASELLNLTLDFPLIVKPKDEGSSRGIRNNSLTFDLSALHQKVSENLKKYNPPLIISEYIEGREFTVGILGNGDEVEVLPIMEIDFSGLPDGMNKIYSFEAKFKFNEHVVYHVPSNIDAETEALIKHSAISAYQSLGIRDYARIDIRLKDHKAYVIEVNSLPGLDRFHSDIIKMARAKGIEYDELIKRIVNIARKRTGK
ncbi:MAG: ATP-grasp domain-containing protein [Clostridiaceae bacterium]